MSDTTSTSGLPGSLDAKALSMSPRALTEEEPSRRMKGMSSFLSSSSTRLIMPGSKEAGGEVCEGERG